MNGLFVVTFNSFFFVVVVKFSLFALTDLALTQMTLSTTEKDAQNGNSKSI